MVSTRRMSMQEEEKEEKIVKKKKNKNTITTTKANMKTVTKKKTEMKTPKEESMDQPAEEEEEQKKSTMMKETAAVKKKKKKMNEEKDRKRKEKSIASIVVTAAISLAGATGSRNLVPFFVNLFIARKQTPEELTVPTIHFALITFAIIATREGFRRACNRQPVPLTGPSEERRDALQRIVNTSWLAVPVGTIVACIVCPIFIIMRQRRSATGVFDGTYAYAVFLQGFASVLESTTEPSKSVSKAVFRFRIATFCELCAAIAGALTTFAIMSFGRIDVTMFSYSRLAVACTVFCVMTVDYLINHEDDFGGTTTVQIAWRRAMSLLPRKIVTPSEPDGAYFDMGLLLLARGYSVQTLMRVVSSEGLKVVLATVASETDQGVYGLVATLGQLFRSLFLWPIETASFQAFSLAVGVGSEAKKKTGAASSGKTKNSKQDDANEKHARARIHEAMVFLMHGIRIAIYVALVCTCFGPHLADNVVRTLYGSTWASTAAPSVLADFYYMIGLMTINSFTDTFMHATASSTELLSATAYSLGVSVSTMSLSAFLVPRVGARGLVFSGALNFALKYVISLCAHAHTCLIPHSKRISDSACVS